MKLTRWISLFGFLTIIKTGEGARCSNGDSIGSNDPNNDRSNDDSSSGMQYVSTYDTTCCGQVTGWVFYVEEAGTVYMQMWRPSGGSTYTLLASNQYTYTSRRFETTETLTTPFSIVSGDVIGWYTDDPAMIPYDNGGSDDFYLGITNTVVSVGGSLSRPFFTRNNKQYAVQATLAPGNIPSFTNLDASVTLTCYSAATGDVIYTVVASDADVTDTLTLSLSSVTPSSHFSFDTATGVVTLNTAPPTITTYSVSIGVNDGCSTTYNTLTIVVADNTPTFTNLAGTASLPCYTSSGTTVFTLTTADNDGVSDTLTTTLDSSTAGSDFAFDAATGVVTVSTSSLTPGSYTLTFTVTDLCGDSTTSTLTITVTNNTPTFTNLAGTASLPCYTSSGTTVFTLTTADNDGVSDTLTTTLDSSTAGSDFAFDAATGVVTVSTSSLTPGSYTLTFTVTDLCGASTTSTLTITVTNNSPTFSNLAGTASLPCYTSSGTTVFTLTTADNDGVSDTLTTTLDSSTAGSDFAFDAATGVVTVSTSSLTPGSYTLTFTVTDLCGDSTTSTLTITVTNNSPTFSNLAGTASIGCYTSSGTTVFTLTTADNDGVSDTLTTTLDSSTAGSDFAFDAATGVVTVSTSSLTPGSYTLTFTVTDLCGDSTTSTLTITVTNNSPFFTNLNAVMTSFRNVAADTVLYTVVSDDNDVSGGDYVTTTLDSTSPSSDFSFNLASGNVTVSSQSLSVTDYTLTFTVTDSCGLTATNTLTISVINNAPVITSLPTTVDVREDETSETLLHTVVVTDADNDDVTCVISDTVPTSAPFITKFINNGVSLDNGIYLDNNPGLDYSAQDTYTLTVNCSDGYAYDVNTLYVYIVQNGMPLISNLQNSTSVSTTTSVSSEVFAVLATDTEGDQMTFTLNCTNTATCPFTIYSSGSILLSQSLLGTTTLVYELDVTVADSYSVSTSHRLSVVVSDLNVAPVLTNLPQTIQVSEDITPGSSLFAFSVYDADGDVNVTFEVVSTPTSGAAKFVVDDSSKTLSLRTTQSLDYEAVTQYVLNVTTDDGTVTSDWGILTLDVADVNESPELLQTYYYIAFDEGTAGTSFNLPVMQVSDPDTGDSVTFSFDVTSNTSCGLLSLNGSTGVMGYATSYDVDDANMSSYFTCLIKVEDSGGLSVTATTTISITDVNDNLPLFSTNSYVFSLQQAAPVGTTLTTLSVVDSDVTAANQQVAYTLSQASSYFAVTSSGVVTLAVDLEAVPVGTTFSANVSVNNLGYSVSDTVTIQMTVMSDDDDDDFWDSGANVAWVTLACVGVVGLIVLAALLWKFKPCCNSGSGRLTKVRPTNSKANSLPRPREDFMRDPPPPYSSTRTLTPTDVNIAGRWDAWGNHSNSGWKL